MNWLIIIALMAFSMGVFVFRRRIKNWFNATDSIKMKVNVFALVFAAPFSFCLGAWGIYTNANYALNKDAIVQKCTKDIPREAKLVVVEQHGLSAIVEFRAIRSGETFWCESDGETAYYF
jgi:hypothetical protein